MRRIVPHLFAAAAMALCLHGPAWAQQPAPQPQMPPMPSMEGEQGDMGKPLSGKPLAGKPPARPKPAEARRETGSRTAPTPAGKAIKAPGRGAARGPSKGASKGASKGPKKAPKAGARHRKR